MSKVGVTLSSNAERSIPFTVAAMVSSKTGPARISALDFTKGALVLIMVLYHWLDYFYGAHDSRYLRFLTPSFIFITGFLVSNVYFSKYGVGNSHLPRRLMYRGVKILAVFIALNLIITFMFAGSGSGRLIMPQLSPGSLRNIFVTGNVVAAGVGKSVVFYILVPISYLLLLSAVLTIVCRVYEYTFQVVCVCFLLGVLACRLNGIESSNLELLAIGLLGVVVGYIPLSKISSFVSRPFALAAAYLLYVVAITLWNVIYPLQIVGVCLSLMILYFLGTRGHDKGKVRSRILLLGRYSLFGYIAQIAILQVLRRGFRHIALGPAVWEISFVLAVVLTQLSVEGMDRARARSTIVDSCYRFVFG
jgi:hypothetical protein